VRKAEKQQSQRSRPAVKSGEAKKQGKPEKLKSREVGNQKSKKQNREKNGPRF
jgi:hypothetical protein